MLNHQTLNHAGGVPTKYDDLIQVMTPRLQHTGSADLQLASYGNVFLDDQFKNAATVLCSNMNWSTSSTRRLTPAHPRATRCRFPTAWSDGHPQSRRRQGRLPLDDADQEQQ